MTSRLPREGEIDSPRSLGGLRTSRIANITHAQQYSIMASLFAKPVGSQYEEQRFNDPDSEAKLFIKATAHAKQNEMNFLLKELI